MIYLATPSTTDARNAMAAGKLGALLTPDSWSAGNPAVENFAFHANDNACYAKGEMFDASDWLAWLEMMRPWQDSCLFAVLPDVVGNAEATFRRGLRYAGAVRGMGYAAALVAQEGISDLEIPWGEIDAIFLGGRTEGFKFGEGLEVATEANRRGLWTHMGRVNSFRRLRSAALAGIDSADGTYLTFGPDKNLRKLLLWLEWIDTHPALRFGEPA